MYNVYNAKIERYSTLALVLTGIAVSLANGGTLVIGEAARTCKKIEMQSITGKHKSQQSLTSQSTDLFIT